MSTFQVPVGAGFVRGDDVGSGPPKVFLHGFALDRRMWTHQVESLSGTARVVAYDLRDFGESSAGEPDRHHVDDLLDVLRHLEITTFDLIGLSLGANVALATAVAAPDRVRRLVLASPGLAGHRWTETRPPDAAAEYARSHDVAATRAFWLSHPLFASLEDHPDAHRRVRQMVEDYPGGHWRGDVVGAPVPPVTDCLSSTRVPTLIINGARDVAGYLEIGEALASKLPCVERTVLPLAGHMSPLEQPDVFTARLRWFLDDARVGTNARAGQIGRRHVLH